jgi:16S rRNA processing protein RimM
MVDETLIHLGKFSGVHGVKGWLKVFSFTRPMEGILDYPVWLISNANQSPQSIKIAEGRKQGQGLLVRLDEIHSRTAAEPLIGFDIHVARSELPVVETGECYWIDLIGLSVQTQQGDSLGIIKQIMETGANDVLVVHGDRERLIPYVQDQVVKQIDLDKGLMIVDWDADF